MTKFKLPEVIQTQDLFFFFLAFASVSDPPMVENQGLFCPFTNLP